MVTSSSHEDIKKQCRYHTVPYSVDIIFVFTREDIIVLFTCEDMIFLFTCEDMIFLFTCEDIIFLFTREDMKPRQIKLNKRR